MFAALLCAFPPTSGYLPPYSDRHRFPPAAVCQWAASANRAFYANLTAERELWAPHWQPVFSAALEDADQLYRTWQTLATVQYDWADEHMTRVRLGVVRDRLGIEAYNAGRPPPVWPTWYFREKR